LGHIFGIHLSNEIREFRCGLGILVSREFLCLLAELINLGLFFACNEE